MRQAIPGWSSRWWRVALAALCTFYLVYGTMLTWIQERLLFPAPSTSPEALAESAREIGAEELRLPTPEGPIYAWWIAPASRLRGAVLYNHGNAEDVSARPALYRHLQRRGWATLAISCPGYPGSPGKPSEAGMARAARAGWTHLTEARQLSPGQIVLHGYSMGGGTVGTLFGQVQPGGAVLESTFTAIHEVARRFAPGLPVQSLLRHPIETITRVPHLQAPLLVVHGGSDGLISVEQGRRLAATAPQGEFLELPGWGHAPPPIQPTTAAMARYDRLLDRVQAASGAP